MICASQIFWTLEVHEAIKAGPHGLPEYQEKLTKQVMNRSQFMMIVFKLSKHMQFFYDIVMQPN